MLSRRLQLKLILQKKKNRSSSSYDSCFLLGSTAFNYFNVYQLL